MFFLFTSRFLLSAYHVVGQTAQFVWILCLTLVTKIYFRDDLEIILETLFRSTFNCSLDLFYGPFIVSRVAKVVAIILPAVQ
jgi:hypothetical protein